MEFNLEQSNKNVRKLTPFQADGLMKERRGRVCRASGTRKGRPPKLDKKEEEDLIAENQRLKMEIEYLKN